ncbi:zinc-binding dehydrogenase [Mesorhizobium sp. B2-4-9]|uniref:quinone oxidoreductase family protein n=1 Tax=Mesorhizobium sp. B2-4-9 TaxID=2589940 RepID=UPI00112AAE98|nr:zinc-binding dehydrogenase [Mesorhizobium sp. B2-4-9]TPL21067.1 zinc-binding dehydrogenase [Mesorhizobium sp. B2-4-9]
MRAVQLNRFGGPEVLEVVEVDTPTPQAGEVLVRIVSSGVNFFEALVRQDRFSFTPALPTVLGVEVSGIIEALGPGVTAPAVGTRVAVPMFALGRFSGGYAEYLAVEADSVVPLPDGLSFDDATALMLQGLTALHLLRQSPPAGKSVLVTSAAGGVGSLLIQLAKQAGVFQVIAAASTPGKLDLAASLGADFTANYANDGWEDAVLTATDGKGVDIAYDFVGGLLTRSLAKTLAPRGEISFVAMSRFDLSPTEVEGLFANNQSLKGFALIPLVTPENLKADLADLFGKGARGELKVTQGGRYPLHQAPEAHRALEGRGTVGKIILGA